MDRGKTIRYLESEIQRAEKSVNQVWLECVEVQLLRDALELIRGNESEAEIEGDPNTWFFVCGECHQALDTKDKYCRACGRRIIWT